MNKPAYGYRRHENNTSIRYDNANVWRNVKEIQLTTF